MNRRRLAALALVALGVWSASCARDPASRIRERSLDEVERMLARPGVTVYDANPREMYEAKHVPGARWIEWDHVTAEALPADRASTLVFYCAARQCSASHESALAAVHLGYRDVSVMPEGIIGWKKAGKPIETGPPPGTSPSRSVQP